jgi:hypothetical protein
MIENRGMRRGFCALLVLVVQWPFSALAESAPWRRIDLPAAVDLREEPRAAPDGWRVSVDGRPHVLASVTFFDGRPEDQASLVFDGEVKRKDKVTRTWRFDSGWKSGVWMQLGYASTAILLARQLPQGTTECRVEFDRSVTVDGFEQIKSIECR